MVQIDEVDDEVCVIDLIDELDFIINDIVDEQGALVDEVFDDEVEHDEHDVTE